MTIHLYNTLTRSKDVFTPIDAARVRVYTCGPTVHNFAHIGNARAAVIPDLLVRLLRHVYGDAQVVHSRNFTDIDDKIIAAAKDGNEPIEAITERYTAHYRNDMAALNIATPDHEPRATDYIPAMLDMIAKLIANGHAYEAEGHVLFSVSSYADYGRLSRRNRDDMIAGARVEVAPYKKDAADFVLWKPSTADQPGWDSPYGFGRPGWHLECSAMNAAINGPHFDIHTGGEDLIFPHHENEIAQSCCAHHSPYVNVWLHNGFLTMQGEKMAKSVGNVFLPHDLLQEFPGEALRYTLLSAHYRQPLDWSETAVQQSRRTLDRYYQILRELDGVDAHPNIGPDQGVVDALCDDLNTPEAFARLASLSRDMHDKTVLKSTLLATGRLLGIFMQSPDDWFSFGLDVTKADADRIESLIAARAEAKKNRDFARADAIRNELTEMGIAIEDTKNGTQWKTIS